MREVLACRKAHPRCYIRVNAFDSTRGFETRAVLHRESPGRGARLSAQAPRGGGRHIQYTIESYAAQAPEGRRYE
jgi:ribulose-bisphosphate carboxylase small chain